mmetsp:Transcript_11595/g.19778  ORF Transcript_11595/g.19778 Transcript_11595/m.19778 type:complete len:188 (-) Transcript_11595:559-1122(-)
MRHKLRRGAEASLQTTMHRIDDDAFRGNRSAKPNGRDACLPASKQVRERVCRVWTFADELRRLVPRTLVAGADGRQRAKPVHGWWALPRVGGAQERVGCCRRPLLRVVVDCVVAPAAAAAEQSMRGQHSPVPPAGQPRLHDIPGSNSSVHVAPRGKFGCALALGRTERRSGEDDARFGARALSQRHL